MENLAEYNENALAITNAEIAANWQLGMLRAVAQSSIRYLEVLGNVLIDRSATTHIQKECYVASISNLSVGTITVTEYYETVTNVKFEGFVSCVCFQVHNKKFQTVMSIESAFYNITLNK